MFRWIHYRSASETSLSRQSLALCPTLKRPSSAADGVWQISLPTLSNIHVQQCYFLISFFNYERMLQLVICVSISLSGPLSVSVSLSYRAPTLICSGIIHTGSMTLHPGCPSCQASERWKNIVFVITKPFNCNKQDLEKTAKNVNNPAFHQYLDTVTLYY